MKGKPQSDFQQGKRQVKSRTRCGKPLRTASGSLESFPFLSKRPVSVINGALSCFRHCSLRNGRHWNTIWDFIGIEQINLIMKPCMLGTTGQGRGKNNNNSVLYPYQQTQITVKEACEAKLKQPRFKPPSRLISNDWREVKSETCLCFKSVQ